MKGDTKKELS